MCYGSWLNSRVPLWEAMLLNQLVSYITVTPGATGSLGAPLELSGAPLGLLWEAFGCSLGLRTGSGLDLKWCVGPLEVSKGALGDQND